MTLVLKKSGKKLGGKVIKGLLTGILIVSLTIVFLIWNQPSPQAKDLVEDWFRYNYLDLRQRETIEWGEPTVDEDGSASIRYKYLATVEDEGGLAKTLICNKFFVFDSRNKWVDTRDVAGFPKEKSDSFGNTILN